MLESCVRNSNEKSFSLFIIIYFLSMLLYFYAYSFNTCFTLVEVNMSMKGGVH